MLLISGILAARLLGVANRGHLALFILLVLIFVQLGGLGLPIATTYWIARDRQMVGVIGRAVVGPAVIQSLSLVALQAVALWFVFGDSEASVRVAAALTLVAGPSVLVHQYVLAALLGQQRFKTFAIIRFLPSAIYSGSLICAFFVHGRDLSLVLVTGAWVGSFVVGGGAGFYVMCKSGRYLTDGATSEVHVRAMISFGLKALLGSISPLEAFNLDQAAVGLFISPMALGFYVVGVSLTNLPQFLAQSIGHVAYPHVAAQEDPQRSHRSIWRFVGAALAVCGGITVLLGLGAPWLVNALFGQAYSPATTLTRILLISTLFMSLRRVLSEGARGAGHPTLGTFAELVSLACLAPSLAVLISHGAQGAAWAMVLASGAGLLFLMVAVVASSRRASAGKTMLLRDS